MPGTISESLEFAPTGAMLGAAMAGLYELGASAGGAVDADVRERALRTFQRASEQTVFPSRLEWSSGRARVPVLPRATPARVADGLDVPALAVENAGGLVHLGSTYLDPLEAAGDRRVTLAALGDARRSTRERVDGVHLQIVAPATDRFTALATAFQNCGAYVEVPDGASIAAPLQLIWMSRPGPPSAVFPHTVIRLGAGARATIVERHIGSTETFVAGIVEADLGPGARLDYVAIQQTDEGAQIFVQRRARCATDAIAAWHVADLGGARVRSVCGAQLAGARASAEANALFFARGFARVETVVDVDHDGARTESRITIRRAATDRARGSFAGALRFAPTATRCVATMRDDGLILSRDAYLDAAPVLAVPSQHMWASHASSVGSLDEQELFYVQSRGITRPVAERMMALAFFEPAIARFPTDALRDEVRTALDRHLNDVPDTFA